MYLFYTNILICDTLYHTCMYNRHPEDEPSGSKHLEDIIN